MRILIIGAALVALSACNKPSEQQANEAQASDNSASPAESGSIKGVDRTHKGSPAPDVVFNDPGGKQTSLKAFAGKPVLVNLWATWCAPCVKELPTLSRVERLGIIKVVAISQDTGPQPSVKAFLQAKAPDLKPYQDPKMALSGKLGAEVLPTSILYDAQGRELWRYVGDLDWNGGDAAKLIQEAYPRLNVVVPPKP